MTSVAFVAPTEDMVAQFWRWFVNRRAFTLQSHRPHPVSGRHQYFRPTDRQTGAPVALTPAHVRQHLAGTLTLGLYAINPETQSSKWVAIDADYRHALEDLLALQDALEREGVDAVLEGSKRGAHLWVFFAEPVPAREARRFVRALAGRLQLPVKGAGTVDGLEIFPRQDALAPGEFGNAIRAPLGVHRGAHRRFWFYHAPYTLADQFVHLAARRRVSGEQLAHLLRDVPVEEQTVAAPAPLCVPRTGEFRILDHVEVRRTVGRNHIAQCPSCAAAGRDTAGDNLAVSVAEPRKYKCWAGCTREMIRAALGCPVPERRAVWA